MAEWIFEVATEYNFPSITVYRKYRDGVHVSWRFVSNEGYVMYDTTENNMEFNSEMMKEVPVTYYYTNVDCPLNYPFDSFTWVAVPRDSVDEKYIFGA